MNFDLSHKIKRKWMKLRLQPIRVFCLHHVCVEFDPESMNACDWMNVDEFKTKVQAMQQAGVEFISLPDAYRHICKDWVRGKKYAVLTFDDGYTSLKEILPWLNEQHIPVTLFLNGKYLDGKSYRKNPKEKYLTKEEINQLPKQYPLLTIASHGWVHNRVSEMTEIEFEKSVELNINLLKEQPNNVPFWAYTYGDHTELSDKYLREQQMVPVYIDGMPNYNNPAVIHRELM